MGITPTNHNKEVIHNIKGNRRQPGDTPTASDMLTYPPPSHTKYMQQKIAKLRLRFIMGTTPTNNNEEVIYNINGNPRQPEDMPTVLNMPTQPQNILCTYSYR